MSTYEQHTLFPGELEITDSVTGQVKARRITFTALKPCVLCCGHFSKGDQVECTFHPGVDLSEERSNGPWSPGERSSRWIASHAEKISLLSCSTPIDIYPKSVFYAIYERHRLRNVRNEQGELWAHYKYYTTFPAKKIKKGGYKFGQCIKFEATLLLDGDSFGRQIGTPRNIKKVSGYKYCDTMEPWPEKDNFDMVGYVKYVRQYHNGDSSTLTQEEKDRFFTNG